MADCEILEDDGSPADIKTGDIATTDGGMLGLGHAGIIEVREGRIVVIEVMAAADGSVHVQERDLCDFLDDYEAQDRDVFISRPKKPDDVSNEKWSKKLQGVVKYVKDRVCTHYPVWKFAMDLLFQLPEVWYCSDIVGEAFRREGIELEINLSTWEASEDASTREFMFLQRGEVIRRFGEVEGERFLRGFELPVSLVEEGNLKDPQASLIAARLLGDCGTLLPASDCGDFSLEAMASEQLWQKEVDRLSDLIDTEFDLAAEMLREASEA